MSSFPEHVATLLRDVLEPVVTTAGFELTRNGGYRPADGSLTALFEAESEAFARSFPALVGDYGGEGPGCVDLWIEYEGRSGRIEAFLEGHDLARWLREHGHQELADAVERPLELERAVGAVGRGLDMMLREARSSS